MELGAKLSSDVALLTDSPTHQPTCERQFLEQEIRNEHVRGFSVLNTYRQGRRDKLRRKDAVMEDVSLFDWFS